MSPASKTQEGRELGLTGPCRLQVAQCPVQVVEAPWCRELSVLDGTPSSTGLPSGAGAGIGRSSSGLHVGAHTSLPLPCSGRSTSHLRPQGLLALLVPWTWVSRGGVSSLLSWRTWASPQPVLHSGAVEWGSLLCPEELLPPLPLGWGCLPPHISISKEPTQAGLEEASRSVCSIKASPPRPLVNCEAHSGCLHSPPWPCPSGESAFSAASRLLHHSLSAAPQNPHGEG